MKLLIFYWLLLMPPSCHQAEESETFRQLKQLEGTWKMQTEKSAIYESWKIGSPQQLLGRSYTIRGTDTLVLENVKLEETNNKIFYIPLVTNQNRGRPVLFTLVSAERSKFIFENKLHDFPQRVIYNIVSKDSIHAWIEGTKNGKERRSDFYYKKVR
ncbi:MAG TPA: DUF6265 family protein [Chitinophagaceae bacterium]